MLLQPALLPDNISSINVECQSNNDNKYSKIYLKLLRARCYFVLVYFFNTIIVLISYTVVHQVNKLENKITYINIKKCKAL